MSRIDELLKRRETDSCIHLRFLIGEIRIQMEEVKDMQRTRRMQRFYDSTFKLPEEWSGWNP